MKKSTVILFTVLLIFNIQIKSQTLQEYSTNSFVEKASYQKGDLQKALWKNLSYPRQALVDRITGDVVLSFIITKKGEIDSVTVVSTPSEMLSLSSVVSLDEVSDGWRPCTVNGIPVDKTYKIVYRYSIWLNSKPPEYGVKAEQMVRRKKYEKALSYYNRAIKDNQYDYKLFEARSQIKELTGDTESAKKDREQATYLRNEVMPCVNVSVVGVTRRVSLGTTIEIRPAF